MALAGECPSLNAGQASEAIASLSSEIQRHDKLYYQQHQPEISDSEYDGLTNKLKQLQKCFPDVITKSHSDKTTDGYNKHLAYMGSLKKADSLVDIERFLERQKPADIILQPKIDGIALELVYQDGKLTKAITRGNGERGQDILRHLHAMPLIPQQIDNKETVTLHGELFVRLDRVDKPLLKQYASARHLVAGLTSQESPNTEQLKAIDFFPWRWINSPHNSETSSYTALKAYGFSFLTQYTHIITSASDAEQWRSRYSSAQEFPFLMDGIVLKADSYSIRQQQGWSQNTPNWAIAWKFPASTGVTEVISISFNIGRTGQITPVLNLSPVHIKGETIARVSMGSVKNLKRKSVAIGDQVSIQLKGAATPVFQRVVFKSPERKQPEWPPQNRYSAFTCLSLSPGCEEQFQARINWMIGSNGLNWPTSDKTLVNQAIHKGKIIRLQDVMAFAPDKKLRVSMAAQIRALSIPGIGKSKSRVLANGVKNWKAMHQASEEELMDKANLSSSTAKTLRDYLKQPEIQTLVHNFHEIDLLP